MGLRVICRDRRIRYLRERTVKDPTPEIARVRHGIPPALPAMLVVAMILVGCTSVQPQSSGGKAAIGSQASSTASAERTTSPSALPSPSPSPTIREASAVAHIPNCQDALGWDYALSGNDFFVVCAGTDEGPGPDSLAAGPYVARVDLSTNKVTATYRYKTPITYIENIVVAGGNLWFDGIFGGSACTESKPGDCDGWRRVERFDLATGKNTLEIRNVELENDAFGYVWIRESSYGDARLKDYLRKLDPATGRENGRIPFSMNSPIFACGSLWGWTGSNFVTAVANTTLARIDPANGHVLAQFTEPGEVFGLQAAGSQCWASVAPGGPDFDLASYADHFVRVGDTGIEYRSPHFDAGIVRHAAPEAPSQSDVWETYVAARAGVFWIVRQDIGPNVSVQRLDPVTWQPSETVWRWSGTTPQGSPFVIVQNSVWAYDSQGGVARLDVPVGES